jgi:hypothetical protein
MTVLLAFTLAAFNLEPHPELPGQIRHRGGKADHQGSAPSWDVG